MFGNRKKSLKSVETIRREQKTGIFMDINYFWPKCDILRILKVNESGFILTNDFILFCCTGNYLQTKRTIILSFAAWKTFGMIHSLRN